MEGAVRMWRLYRCWCLGLIADYRERGHSWPSIAYPLTWFCIRTQSRFVSAKFCRMNS